MTGYLWHLATVWAVIYLSALTFKLVTRNKLLHVGWCSISVQTTALNRSDLIWPYT